MTKRGICVKFEVDNEWLPYAAVRAISPGFAMCEAVGVTAALAVPGDGDVFVVDAKRVQKHSSTTVVTSTKESPSLQPLRQIGDCDAKNRYTVW